MLLFKKNFLITLRRIHQNNYINLAMTRMARVQRERKEAEALLHLGMVLTMFDTGLKDTEVNQNCTTKSVV